MNEILETVETQVTNELVKNNVTEAVINKLKKDYLPLKIEGINDKTGYEAVRAARIECKNIRILAEKICKKGRESAILIQKAWISKEKEVTGQISEVENHLQNEQKIVDEEKERIKQEALRKEEERIQNRMQKLFNIKKLPNYEFIKNMTDDEFNKFYDDANKQYEEMQAIEAEKARKEKEESERIARIAEEQRIEQERLQTIQEEQARKEDAIKAEQQRLEHEKLRLEREKQHQVELEKAREEARLKAIEDEKKRIESERLRKAEEERQAKLEAERLAALRPDKEKLITLADILINLEFPKLQTDEASRILEDAQEHLWQAIKILKGQK